MTDKTTDRPYRPLVYVASPLSGDVEANNERTRSFCRFVVEQGCIPLAPQLMYPQFMNDEDQAAQVRKICENYLAGMSFIASAADVGLTMSHCGVKRMIQNPRYIGDSFYPAIITEETARKLEDERKRREKILGRDKLKKTEIPAVTIQTSFHIPIVEMKYKDPIKQAEYAYSQIRSEVSD